MRDHSKQCAIVLVLAGACLLQTTTASMVPSTVRDINDINTDAHIESRRATCRAYVSYSQSYRASGRLSILAMNAAGEAALRGINNIMSDAWQLRENLAFVAEELGDNTGPLKNLLEDLENNVAEELLDLVDKLVEFIIQNASEAIELAENLGWDYYRVVELMGMLLDEGAAISELFVLLAPFLA